MPADKENSLISPLNMFVHCQIYLHNVIRTPSVRVRRPFLSLGFIMLAVMCSLARYGLHYNYWTDVLVGFGLGIVIAVYSVSMDINSPMP